jgi:hypothetical protein
MLGKPLTISQTESANEVPCKKRRALVHVRLIAWFHQNLMASIAHGMAEYFRPWKLTTLSGGVVLLLLGSYYTPAPDWDIPVSLIMAFVTYLTAPWSMRVLLERKWRYWPYMLLATWFSVDGCYALYWYWKEPSTLALMREANFAASLSLYGLCGIIWLYRGTLRELLAEVWRVLPNIKRHNTSNDA